VAAFNLQEFLRTLGYRTYTTPVGDSSACSSSRSRLTPAAGERADIAAPDDRATLGRDDTAHLHARARIFVTS
jgi:hypothetical protein